MTSGLLDRSTIEPNIRASSLEPIATEVINFLVLASLLFFIIITKKQVSCGLSYFCSSIVDLLILFRPSLLFIEFN
ncbi:hypothetical protein NC651_011723 [Populus alba x Populus x berolinensis]|nr:hypothetical protein NC651_011723 [Populus alba x Populus x berolinensis]